MIKTRKYLSILTAALAFVAVTSGFAALRQSFAQAPLNPALTGPQFGERPSIAPNTPLAGHIVVGSLNAGAAGGQLPPSPGTTSCTLVAGSTDTAGRCSATATSGVAVTFANAFSTTPFCTIIDQTTFSGNALAARTATGFTMGTTVAADIISWTCFAAPGG